MGDISKGRKLTRVEIQEAQAKNRAAAEFDRGMHEAAATGAAVVYGSAVVGTGATVAGAILSDDGD